MTATNLPSPAVTFRVNLELNKTEAFGPITNNQDVGVLTPDRYTTFIDDQQAPGEAERKYQRSALLGVNKSSAVASPAYLSLPGVANINNLQHGDEFTLYGMQALEIRRKFASGSWNSNSPTGGLGAVLTVVE